ncbi:MAG: AAA family ATPase, partial [Halarcobacter sp.]
MNIGILDDNIEFISTLEELIVTEFSLQDVKDSDHDIKKFLTVEELYINDVVKSFDLLIIDLNLGGKFNGIEIVRSLRKKNVNCFVQLITGDDVESLERENADIQRISFIQKGTHLFEQKLFECIDSVSTGKVEVISQKVEQYIAAVNSKLYEREEVTRVIMLTILCGVNLFFYGPPGTGKSEIIESVKNTLKGMRFFRHLMTDFTEFDDIFGEVAKGEDGKRVRDLETGTLLARIGFYDEIFKSNDAILNSFLTYFLEKLFDNFNGTMKCPLRSAFGASNEFPKNQGLAALFERFQLRIPVLNVQKKENIIKILNNSFDANSVELPVITEFDLMHVDKNAQNIKFSNIAENMFYELREKLTLRMNAINEGERLYDYSSRTVRTTGKIMRVSALLNQRTHVDESEMMLLKYIAWNNMEQRKIVFDVIDTYLFGDQKNLIEEIDIFLRNDMKDMKSRYQQSIKSVFDLNKVLQSENEFEQFKQLVKEFKALIDKNEMKLKKFIAIMARHDELVTLIDKNLFLHTDSMVPWNLNTQMSYHVDYSDVGESDLLTEDGLF